MRLHLPALPGQPVTKQNSHCAYTQKIRRLADMLDSFGHEVIVYAGEECDAAGEHVEAYLTVTTEPVPSEPHHRAWVEADAIVAHEIRKRLGGDDILCVPFGRCQEALAEKLDIPAVETGIGYTGVFAPWRVYESHAWLHAVTAAEHGTADTDGSEQHTVIPNAYEPDEFQWGAGGGGYALYLGRMIERKGVAVADRAAEIAGMPIIFAGGHGDWQPTYGEAIGPVGPEARAELLANAEVLIAPTRYLEPFGGVAVEAQFAGCPVIASPWGAFPETVIEGATGYLAATAEEIAERIPDAMRLDRRAIRQKAVERYSTEAIAPMYDRFLRRVCG